MVNENGGFVKNIVKGVLGAVIVALVGVLIFAFIIKVACLNGGVIKSVNQFIKILAVFLGCAFSVRGKGGLIKGALIGMISMSVVYLLFALFGSKITFGAGFIIDIIFGLIVGAISGIITVNVKK